MYGSGMFKTLPSSPPAEFCTPGGRASHGSQFPAALAETAKGGLRASLDPELDGPLA